MENEQRLEEILTPLLNGMRLSLVEASVSRHKGDVKVNLVLYKQGGISLDDLTGAQKILRPRLELEYDREGLSMEISSPGLSRVVKSPKEYRIFKGRNFRLLLEEEWIDGVLRDSDENSVSFETAGEILEIPVTRIRKAKLV
jgi:ribosome maturation factor RimP